MSQEPIRQRHPLADPKVWGPPAIRTFLNIAKSWNLTDEEVCALMNINNTDLTRWRQGSTQCLDDDRMLRFSYVFGIYKALQILIPDSADRWVLRTNTAKIFNGWAPISVMCKGPEGLQGVRRYLDAHLG